jgi:predicted nucleotidyltransferase component of viral defense system
MIKQIIQLLWYPLPRTTTTEAVANIVAIADQHGFDRYKLEKDFWLTILLIDIGHQYPDLIFKWGTCLNKIYYHYFRLSEDLDFNLIHQGNRNQNKQVLEYYKQQFSSSRYRSIWLQLIDKRTKFNEDTQWCFEFVYTSWIDKSSQTIKVDIKIEPQLILPPVSKPIWSIFIDPVLWEPLFHDHQIHVMDLRELVAEKMRAALTRKSSAIRDFFDIRYIRQQWFDISTIRPLIHEKIWSTPYTIAHSVEYLTPQVSSELIPVLGSWQEDFNLIDIFSFISSFKN